jgi:hypothetical protein
MNYEVPLNTCLKKGRLNTQAGQQGARDATQASRALGPPLPIVVVIYKVLSL